jgi:RNA-splicing ligase RtcB
MKELQGKYNTAKIFATTIESACEDQIQKLLDESWIAGSKIRIMPDCHAGKGCVIGTTMTITDKVVPNLVGVDIGCAVLTTNLGKVKLDLPVVDNVIKDNIPMGKNLRDKPKVNFSDRLKDLWFCRDYISFPKVNASIGSLGGGNHFIELDVDDDKNVYLVVHSGSRNFGKTVAEYYQNKAEEYHKGLSTDSVKLFVQQMKDEGKSNLIEEELKNRRNAPTNELAYLEGSLFQSYLNDMRICQEMASLNRKTITDIIISCLDLRVFDQFETVHNYIDLDSMILRKGAISARLGEKVLIPINMRDGSLICVGKGNQDYNNSAPHGAGRLMSRTEAKRTISLEDFQKSMKGIYSSTVIRSTLDEAPMAYKSIDEIKENIVDTVDLEKHIRPIYNVKASE